MRDAGRRPLVGLVALLLVASPAAAGGQQAEGIAVGAHVRVRVRTDPQPASWVRGTLLARDTTALVVQPRGDAPSRIAWRDVDRVDVRVRQRSAGAALARGALRGALVGGGIAVIATGAEALHEWRHPCDDCFIPGTVIIGVLGVGFTVVTTVVGGAIGLGSRDVWQRVSSASP